MTRKAKELQLEHAEAMCVDHCRRRVSVDNAVEWFVEARLHGGTLLGSTRRLWCLILSHIVPAQLTVSQRGTFTRQLCKLTCLNVHPVFFAQRDVSQCGTYTRRLWRLNLSPFVPERPIATLGVA